MSNETIAFIGVLLFMAVVGISAMYFISKYPTDGVTAMSDEPKCTDALQAEIAQQYRNINSKPGLEIGLRPELGTYELCDKHYDASRTEAAEHCAVCQLQARIAELQDPGWHAYLELTQAFLKHYPPDIFTGVSGDPGPLFVVAIRNALAALQESSDE